jgi:hypothetical protein
MRDLTRLAPLRSPRGSRGPDISGRRSVVNAPFQPPVAEPEGARPYDSARNPPRLMSVGIAESLERFCDPQLIGEGRVILISLEAVQARFGRRWELRQEQVYEFADRVLERGVGAAGMFLRVSETDYLIVHTDRARLAAQAAGLRYLREILQHFLGDSHMADLGVLQVTKIVSNCVEAEPVDAAAADASDDSETAALRTEEPPAARRTLDEWSPFVAGDGRRLRVSAHLEPVYELKRFTRIGFRMIRRVVVVGTEEELSRAAVTNLTSADILQADLATVARGLQRLYDEGTGQPQLTLIVPLSYVSLASQRGRAEIVKLLNAASGMLRCGVICEICDIEGVPPGSLLSAATLIKPFTLLVAGQLIDARDRRVAAYRNHGLNAVTIQCPSGLSDAEFEDWATPAVAAARRVARSVMVYGVETPRRAAQLRLIGATHASIDLR